MLLGVLDDGRLTDGQGRTVDFKNTLVIMTSNVGSQHLRELQADNKKTIERRVEEELRATFRPEFLNRIDEIIFFEPLRREQMDEIVKIQVSRFADLLRDRGLTLELAPEAVELIAERGFDPIYGARPLKRSIQKNLIDPLATALLGGAFGPGDRIVAGVDGDHLRFDKAGSKSEAA